jgi:predicted PurR-regulated permease PerM
MVIGNEILYAIFLILVISFFVLIKIAYYVKNININRTENIIKHINKNEFVEKKSCNIEESNDNKKKRVEDEINFESKWEKKDLKSNLSGIGDENIVDGTSSLNAIDLMREMNKSNKKKSG